MTDIRTCLQRLVDIWDDPNLRHELPGAMWHAKEALKASETRRQTSDCGCPTWRHLSLAGCQEQSCPRRSGHA